MVGSPGYNQTTNKNIAMSQTKETTIYGQTVTAQPFPDTADEWDKTVGVMGDCVNTSIDNYIQHVWKGKVRKRARALIVKAGVPEEDPSGKTLKDEAHFKLAAAQGVDVRGLLQQAASETAVELSASSSGRLGQTWLDQADSHLETVSDPNVWSQFMDNVVANNPGFQFDVEETGVPTRESVAMALKTEDARVRKLASASLFSA